MSSSFALIPFTYLSSLTSSHSSVSSKHSGRLRSCNVSVCLNWKHLFLPTSCFFSPHYGIYLHPSLVASSLCDFLSLLLRVVCCSIFSVHAIYLPLFLSLLLPEINISVHLSGFVNKIYGSWYTARNLSRAMKALSGLAIYLFSVHYTGSLKIFDDRCVPKDVMLPSWVLDFYV